MKNFFRLICLCFFTAVTLTAGAWAAEDTLKVGLYYGSSALFSANLQNDQGSGYTLGWFDEETRDFHGLGRLDQEKISVTADGAIYISKGTYHASPMSSDSGHIGGYHVQMDDVFAGYEEARYAAGQLTGAFPAYIDGAYRVRVGDYLTREEAEIAAATYGTYAWRDSSGGVHTFSGAAVAPSATGVTVTVTATDEILFEFDCAGARSLGIMPDGGGGEAVTWFRGYRWYGGFEYRRSAGGSINVINVVDIDDYVRGVLPYEMAPDWPLEALKAQAVCARTYALWQSKHYDSYGFDVCNTTDCQVYYGLNQASELTDRAAEETAGVVVTYGGDYAETYYCSSNGGASESAGNVWLEDLPYLVGKEDPYEGTISIPGYRWSVSYTWEELTRLLQSKGYSIGSVRDAYVSRTTPTGNVAAVTFADASGRTVTVTGERCRTVFYTTLFGSARSVGSMRFTITGGSGGGGVPVNGDASLLSVSGASVITGDGLRTVEGDSVYVITAGGVVPLEPEARGTPSAKGITITGTGSGHNVGMSQYGARAMAELGYTYEDILTFYFTGVKLERIR